MTVTFEVFKGRLGQGGQREDGSSCDREMLYFILRNRKGDFKAVFHALVSPRYKKCKSIYKGECMER